MLLYYPFSIKTAFFEDEEIKKIDGKDLSKIIRSKTIWKPL